MIKKMKHLLVDIKNFFFFRLTDYYFISYPKCGRTWTRYFLSEYLNRLCGRNFSLEFDELIRHSTNYPRIIYTHAHHRNEHLDETKEFANWLQNHNKNIIFLVRDPRDVVVSSYFQYTKRNNDHDFIPPDTSLSEFIKLPHTGIQKIVNYMNLWYRSKEDFGNFCLLRYEQLKKDPHSEFSRFVNYLDVDHDDDILDIAIDESSFDNMRKAERSENIDNHRLRPADPDDEESYKTRRGVVGGYRDYLRGDSLEFADRAVSELVDELGYGD